MPPPPRWIQTAPRVFTQGSGRIEAGDVLGWGVWIGKVGAKAVTPPPSEHKDEGSRAELSRCSVSQAAHPCNFCPVPVSPAHPRFRLAAPSQRTRGGWWWWWGGDAASLPSIWCCMPLSGCQPAHSNEGCHQGYCMLERCLLLLASLSFFILFVRDTRRIYTTATRQQSP